MNKRSRYELTSYLKEIKSRCSSESRRLDQLKDYSHQKLRLTHNRSGKEYYYVYVPERKGYKYLGNCDNNDVNRIKEAHYLQLSISKLQHEIQLIENMLSMDEDLSYEHINGELNKAYRNARISQPKSMSVIAKEWKESKEEYKRSIPPFRPEELIHKTRDGSYVRSKGEALIYNYLLELGVTFVYEYPLTIRQGYKETLLRPDFMILSETDYKTVIFFEHQGMMNDTLYRDRFKEKVYKYWINNYLPERDVFFTFDLPNGGFDDTPIKSILQRYIRPEL